VLPLTTASSCWSPSTKSFWLPRLRPGGVTSIGVPIGVGVIVFTIILTWIYVRRANTEFDATNEAIIKEAEK
jgi:uncharacterized membrane protein (DUF485 family)